MKHRKHVRGRNLVAVFCIIMTVALAMIGCSSSEQQVVDRPGEEQQVVDRPSEGRDGQQVDRPDEGGNGQQGDQPTGSGEDQQVVIDPNGEEIPVESSLPENVSFIITIRINPEFQLHIDDNDRIVDVIPVNEDAKTMCQGLDVIGMSYADGLPIVMEQAHIKGYLKNGDFVEVQILFHQASQQTMEQYNIDINTVIQQYAADHALTGLQFGGGLGAEILLENEDPNWNPEQYANQSANQPSKNENIVETETDTAGNVIYFKEMLSGGGYVEVFLRADGTDSKHIFHEPDGTIVTILFDDNGTLAQENTKVPDGFCQTVWFNEVGLAVRAEVQEPDGVTSQISYYANGATATSRSQFPDGSWMESTYSEDGLSSHSLSSDGSESHYTYYASGQKAVVKQVFSGGNSLEEHYDENGNLTLSIAIDTRGVKAETRFNADHSGSMTQYGLDGSSSTVYFRPDGKVTHGYDSNGNYYEETGDVYAGTKNGGKG